MFFTKFPIVRYTLTDELGDVHTKLTTDVTTRVVFQKIVEALNVPYVFYDIQDGERPDTIAAKYYGSSRYTWLVLLANDLYHAGDWPMTEREFAVYINKVYGSLGAAQSTVYAYRNANGLSIDETTYNTLSFLEKSSVSYYDWEVEQNDARRRIKLIPRTEVTTIVRQLDNVLGDPTNINIV